MDVEKFGKFIKMIRKNYNLTQKDLADKYNVTPQAVSKWERGLNMPDISLIREMSKDFNIPIDDLLEGKSTNNKFNKLFLIPIVIIIILVIFIILIINKDDSFTFSTISSTCEDFTITGTIAYNSTKSSIYITNINYCGNEFSEEEYKYVECILYESNDNIVQKLSTYEYDGYITIDEFLSNVTLSIDNYQSICKDYNEDSLYLVINATDSTDVVTTHTVYLSLDDGC